MGNAGQQTARTTQYKPYCRMQNDSLEFSVRSVFYF